MFNRFAGDLKSSAGELGEWEKHTKGIGAKLLIQVFLFSCPKVKVFEYDLCCRWVINQAKDLEKVCKEEVSLWKPKCGKEEEPLV